MDLKDVLRPYEKLVEIEILGRKFNVPENNSLLRCFQFLSIENISYGEFCWNGECLNCQIWLQNGDRERSAMACRTDVKAGMKIVQMAKYIDLSDVIPET